MAAIDDLVREVTETRDRVEALKLAFTGSQSALADALRRLEEALAIQQRSRCEPSGG